MHSERKIKTGSFLVVTCIGCGYRFWSLFYDGTCRKCGAKFRLKEDEYGKS
jgi:rRNA maturation endonuclease Nob1